MLGSGDEPSPVRLWWARLDDDGATRSVEISGLPLRDRVQPARLGPGGRIVVAYDAGNAVVRAWRVDGDELEPLWRRDGLAHAGHLIVYPRHARAGRRRLAGAGRPAATRWSDGVRRALGPMIAP